MLAAAEAQDRRQRRLVALVAAAVARLPIDPAAIAESWALGIGAVLRVVVAAQLAAAAAADEYVGAALDEQGLDDIDPGGAVLGVALAGVAGDGRPLGTLAEVPRWTALDALAAGGEAVAVVQGARSQLLTVMATAVQDTSRAAETVAIAARPSVGYTRMLVGKSCSRCVVLAGRFYRWNDGFLRHPRDDCRHIPTRENVAGDVRTDPRAYFDALPEAEQDRRFTRAGAQAIRDGADLAQVVNARLGMTTATVGGRQVAATTRGTRRSGRGPRLMPEAIARIAEDRADAVRLLRANGYLTT